MDRRDGGGGREKRRERRVDDELTWLEDPLRSLLRSFGPFRKSLLSRESVGKLHLRSRLVDDGEFEVSKEFAPASLTTSEDLRGVEVLESFVIRVNGDLGRVAFAVLSPFPEAFHDGEHFLVVDFVVEFGGVEFSRVECDGMRKVVRR